MATKRINESTTPGIRVPEVSRTEIGKGYELFALESPGKELARILIRFDHPTLFSTRSVESQMLFQLMKSGTHNMPLFDFVTRMEATGAMLSCYTGADSGTVELVVLNEQIPEALPLVFEMIFSPALPEDEFQRIHNIALENYTISRRQTQAISREKLMQRLFVNHPYGIVPDREMIASLTLQDVELFHRQLIGSVQPALFVAAANPLLVTNTIRDLVKGESVVELPDRAKTDVPRATMNGEPDHAHTVIQGAVQSSIRMGRRMFSKGHADYTAGRVATTILGGYFSSRLMANLREDKGYTYGVGAGLMTFPDDGYLSVSAEVGAEHLEQAKGEIRQELDRMRHEPPDAEELHTVKQYLKGNALRKTDGVFNQLSLIASLHRDGLPPDWFSKFLMELDAITPKEIMAFAIKWFNPADLIEVTAGPVMEIKYKQ